MKRLATLSIAILKPLVLGIFKQASLAFLLGPTSFQLFELKKCKMFA
jgi:hypothetical protein